jgi:hypothetical protein
MTPLEILEVVALALAVIISLCLAMYRAADRTITALSADASLDPEPYQPRASTEPEPKTVEILFGAIMLICLIAAFVWLWIGAKDEFARWVLIQLAAMHPH